MNRPKSTQVFPLLAALLIFSMLLAACAPKATPTVAPAEPTAVPAQPTTPPAAEQPTAAPAQPTAAPTAAPAVDQPVAGGTLTYPLDSEPATLDSEKASMSVESAVMSNIGAALVSRDKDNKYVPWLADSWEIAPDGLTYTFKLRQGVKFHDGAELTADDWVYTFTRAIDPATKSPGTGQMIAGLTKAEAVDKYTLKLTLGKPNAAFLFGLSAPDYVQPLEKAAVEKGGDQYGHKPVGVGPYIFKEWVTGDHITLERNPDYTWHPAYSQNKGPFYIQTIIFRIIPEMATIVAGLEAGELDYSNVMPTNLERIKATDIFDILEMYGAGTYPYLSMNLTKEPWSDIKVRQAISYALDRQTMVDAILQGQGKIQCGPITEPVIGYWPGVEKMCYTYDPEKAKALMKEAGWTPGSDGILTKDGKPFKYQLLSFGDSKPAEMIVEQLKAIGMQLEIQQLDPNIVFGEKLPKGDFDISINGIGYPEADLLYLMFHSSQIGGLNTNWVKDPELDKMLENSRTATDPAKRQEILNQIQQYIVEHAYIVTTYTQKLFIAMNKKVHGYIFSPLSQSIYMDDAWIKE